MDRDSLDRHITGNYGADQEIEHDGHAFRNEGDQEAWELYGGDEDDADYGTTTLPPLPALAGPFDPADCSGVFDGFGVVSDADPGL